ncbi:MAG: GNAT family N-acetyltransferase [Actinomycetota bacterium]|nr:GNAT family N-acetyltransferase [Actinomycetota bacterium]
MELREASTKDAPQIAAVHVETWQAAYRALLPADFLASLDVAQRVRAWHDRLLAGEVAQSTVVAERDGAIVGFAVTGASRDEGAGTGVGELMAIYCHPRAWGTGVGRALITDAVERLRAAGYEEATLWVLEGNARAERFYGAAGWRADGAQKRAEIGGKIVRELRYRRDLRGVS